MMSRKSVFGADFAAEIAVEVEAEIGREGAVPLSKGDVPASRARSISQFARMFSTISLNGSIQSLANRRLRTPGDTTI